MLTMRSPALGKAEFRAPTRKLSGRSGAYHESRPECLFFARGDAAAENSVPGVVEEVIFTGGVTRFRRRR